MAKKKKAVSRDALLRKLNRREKQITAVEFSNSAIKSKNILMASKLIDLQRDKDELEIKLGKQVERSEALERGSQIRVEEIRRLSKVVDNKIQEIATLKKALEDITVETGKHLNASENKAAGQARVAEDRLEVIRRLDKVIEKKDGEITFLTEQCREYQMADNDEALTISGLRQELDILQENLADSASAIAIVNNEKIGLVEELNVMRQSNNAKTTEIVGLATGQKLDEKNDVIANLKELAQKNSNAAADIGIDFFTFRKLTRVGIERICERLDLSFEGPKDNSDLESTLKEILAELDTRAVTRTALEASVAIFKHEQFEILKALGITPRDLKETIQEIEELRANRTYRDSLEKEVITLKGRLSAYRGEIKKLREDNEELTSGLNGQLETAIMNFTSRQKRK